ncbi:MAG: hypothetical protein J5871_05535 [Bacteroidales bacterium]|nr:hypothetical protein [Bacteroidales bacterium]
MSAPAFSVSGCRKPASAPPSPATPPAILPATDTHVFRLRIHAEAPVRKLDILAYNEEGLLLLDGRMRWDNCPSGTLLYRSRNGADKRIAAIANCPFDLNESAIRRYETLERLEIGFRDDAPQAPVQSGVAGVAAGGQADIRLTPLRCRITLAEVENRLGGYTLLESPRLYLLDANASAEVLRTEGFRPSALLQRPVTLPLPCDIGLFARYPDATLTCFPNDSPLPGAGTPSTQLVLECEVQGKTCRFATRLPPLARNASLYAALSVRSETDFQWRLYPADAK